MGMIECRECKAHISDTATSCPKCGYKGRTSPFKLLWQLLLWGFFLFVLLPAGCMAVRMANKEPQSATAPSPSSYTAPAAPANYRLQIVSQECSGAYGTSDLKLTVENRGDELRYAQVFVEFLDKSGRVVGAQDAFLSPLNIPVGARASMRVFSDAAGITQCRVARIQDRKGTPVVVFGP